MYWPRLRFPPGLGAAFWLALMLVGLVELALHSEAVVHKYRAVFALGRAYDKLYFVERNPPHILFVGNSRTDNGIDPGTVSQSWPNQPLRSFNLACQGPMRLSITVKSGWPRESCIGLPGHAAFVLALWSGQ